VKKIQFFQILLAVFLLSSCATPRSIYKKGYNFAALKTIRVKNFASSVSISNSGSVVAGEFMRQLLEAGYTVRTTDDQVVDAILEGNVTEYAPNKKYLIKDDKDTGPGRKIIIDNRAIEISGSNVYSLGPAFGLDKSNQIIVSNATVGTMVYLKDAVTGDVIWSASYTYEGIDLPTALESVVNYILSSLPKNNS
jgi:hypothetical protein